MCFKESKLKKLPMIVASTAHYGKFSESLIKIDKNFNLRIPLELEELRKKQRRLEVQKLRCIYI